MVFGHFPQRLFLESAAARHHEAERAGGLFSFCFGAVQEQQLPRAVEPQGIIAEETTASPRPCPGVGSGLDKSLRAQNRKN